MTENILIPHKIADFMVNVQKKHSLPLEISFGEEEPDGVWTSVVYNERDEKVFLWCIEKAIFDYVKPDKSNNSYTDK